jgi:serine/threonine-protein kinase
MGRRVELTPGEVVGEKYVVDRRLGEGGMGTVYLARHSLTDRKVALKWVPLDDEVTRERTLVEARSMGRLSHPNVVGVLDAGQHDDAVFLAMEYLSGQTLRAYVGGRSLEPAEAIDLLMPALCGVAAAHQAGVLHRDLKPDNLFVCLDHKGTVFDTKVLDFGVAKEMKDGVAVSSLTNAGMIVGTPKYMAPEQLASGPKLDPRADVYALGLILYEMLTGRLPYDTGDIRTMAVAILRGALLPLEMLRPELSPALCATVGKALATERDARHASVAELARALEPFAGTKRFEAPRKMRATMDGEIPEDVTAPEFGMVSARTRRDPRPLQPSTTTPIRLGNPVRERQAPTTPRGAVAEAIRDPEVTSDGSGPRERADLVATTKAQSNAPANTPAGPPPVLMRMRGASVPGRPVAPATQGRSATFTLVALATAALVAWAVLTIWTGDAGAPDPNADGADAPAPMPTPVLVAPASDAPAVAPAPASGLPAVAPTAPVAPAPVPATDESRREASAAAPRLDPEPAQAPARKTARTIAPEVATDEPTGARPQPQPTSPQPTTRKVQARGGTLRSEDF